MHNNVEFAKKMPFIAHQFTGILKLKQTNSWLLDPGWNPVFLWPSPSSVVWPPPQSASDLVPFSPAPWAPEAPITCQSPSSPKAPFAWTLFFQLDSQSLSKSQGVSLLQKSLFWPFTSLIVFPFFHNHNLYLDTMFIGLMSISLTRP